MGSARLDKALVTAGLASSRTRAGALISAGEVSVDGRVVTKASAPIKASQKLRVREHQQWVSRAAYKLLGALETFPQVNPSGKRCLDAGASTGGFTQVLLSRGAEHVVAVDVGHDQLAREIRQDPRVTAVEGTNLRYSQRGDFGDTFNLIVADLSFISLRLVLPALAEQTADDADLLLMVKPQFEVGRERLGRTGVVSSPDQRREAVEAVIEEAQRQGLVLVAVARSSLPGQDGNAEFFLHLHHCDQARPKVSAVEVSLDTVTFHDE